MDHPHSVMAAPRADGSIIDHSRGEGTATVCAVQGKSAAAVIAVLEQHREVGGGCGIESLA